VQVRAENSGAAGIIEEEAIDMPFGDGTGPRGMGPMTGRGAGYCTGAGRPGFANMAFGRGWFGFNPGFGRGMGMGRGRGRGMAWRRFDQFSTYPRW
jgi:hypothetical protein